MLSGVRHSSNFGRRVVLNIQPMSMTRNQFFTSSKTMDYQKALFTPGPLNTSVATKNAMLLDWGSRDIYFMNVVKDIRSKLLDIGEVKEENFTTIPMQGAGTFSIESVFTTSIPRENAKVVIFSNGAYGDRLNSIVKYMGIKTVFVRLHEKEPIDMQVVETTLKENPTATNVACVHSETSTGIINPITQIGASVRQHCPNAFYFVDAMSSFGASPLNLESDHIDFMVSSANKCLEGVPGFGFVIARKTALAQCEGRSRSLSFDLWDQNRNLDKTGQFRFTPATHSMIAFREALLEFEEEGGRKERLKRYIENNKIIREELKKLGFKMYLKDCHQGPFITSFHYPTNSNFDFPVFYQLLNDQNLCIYPGKVSNEDCFRIGNIGQLHAPDMYRLVDGIRLALEKMGIEEITCEL